VSFDQLRTGCAILFPYLGVREAERGETEGRKSRPVAVGVRIARPKRDDVLVLFPITSQPPSPDRFAVEIPEMEKRRAGLDARTLSASHSTLSQSRRSAGSAKRSFCH
jgi:hypothetical protein